MSTNTTSHYFASTQNKLSQKFTDTSPAQHVFRRFHELHMRRPHDGHSFVLPNANCISIHGLDGTASYRTTRQLSKQILDGIYARMGVRSFYSRRDLNCRFVM